MSLDKHRLFADGKEAWNGWFYWERDLKAAIKELKKKLCRIGDHIAINEVFGPGLVDNHSPKESSGFSDEISDLNKSPADSVEEEKDAA